MSFRLAVQTLLTKVNNTVGTGMGGSMGMGGTVKASTITTIMSMAAAAAVVAAAEVGTAGNLTFCNCPWDFRHHLGLLLFQVTLPRHLTLNSVYLPWYRYIFVRSSSFC